VQGFSRKMRPGKKLAPALAIRKRYYQELLHGDFRLRLRLHSIRQKWAAFGFTLSRLFSQIVIEANTRFAKRIFQP
jgi:hypothetical protein